MAALARCLWGNLPLKPMSGSSRGNELLGGRALCAEVTVNANAIRQDQTFPIQGTAQTALSKLFRSDGNVLYLHLSCGQQPRVTTQRLKGAW